MKKIFISAILAVFAFSGFAQNSSRVLTVEDAVNLALENNLSIKQSKMDLDILALKDKYSWNSISPSFSLSGGVNTSVRNSFDGDDSSSSSGWSVTGSMNMSFTPALATSIKAAKLAYETGEMTLEDTKRSIELSVRKQFYSLVYFNENLELQQRSLETAKQTYESNLKKYGQGRFSELNLLTSQFNYESKVPAISKLENSYENLINNFKQVLGLELSEQIELTGNLDDVVSAEIDESVLQQDLDSIPSVKSLKKALESTENSLQATKYSAYGPSASLSLSDSVGKTNSKSKMGDSKGKTSNSLSVSLNVRIPLDGYLPWSNGAITIASLEENIEKMNQKLEQTKTTTSISMRNTYNSIIQAKTQLVLLEKNVELVQKTYDMTKRAYEMGSSDLLSLQTAEDNLFQARYNVTNQKYTIISNILDLENTLGIPFGTLSQLSDK